MVTKALTSGIDNYYSEDMSEARSLCANFMEIPFVITVNERAHTMSTVLIDFLIWEVVLLSRLSG